MFPGKKISAPHEALALLNCLRLPGRLTSGEAAVVLGFQEHDLAPLVSAKMLTPLGNPAQNAPKYFAAVDVQRCVEDRKWLEQATKTLTQYWKKKNQAKRDGRLALLLEDHEAVT